MKHTMKRGLSLVLALCMVLGLVVLPGVTEAKAEETDLIEYHSMDTNNTTYKYYASGFTKVKNKTTISGGSIKEDANGNTYWDLRMDADGDSSACWVSYTNTSMDKTTVLKYRIMLDDTTASCTFYPLTLSSAASGRTVGLSVVKNKVTISSASKELSTGVWHDIEIVTNENAVTIYIDDSYFYNSASYKNLTNVEHLNYITSYFGASSTSSFAGVGYGIDEMYIYNYAPGTTLAAAADSYAVTVGDIIENIWTKNQDNYLPALSFKSSDEEVATVDANGVVTAVGAGEATITAIYGLPGTATMGKATTTVTVTEDAPQQPDPLKFSYAVPVLANDLAIEFQAKGELFGEGKYTNPTASFTFNGTTVNMPLTYNSQADLYVALFTGIAPHQMGDEITYTLSATYDGETVTSVANTYSMLQYCTNELENSPDAELEALLVSTLNYGAAAQTYSGYKTTSLVNARLTPEQQTVATRELAKVTSTGENNKEQQAVWKTATVILDNAVVTEFTFQSELSDLTVKINGSTDYVTVVAGADNMYTVYYEGLNAAQLSDSLTAVVYSGDEAVSSTLTYSVESCAYYHVNENADAGDALKALVKALVAYGDAASAFNN